MLTVAECYATYRELSGRASDVSRQLAFAAFGIVWVLKGDGSGFMDMTPRLQWAALLAAISLGCDLLQYAVGALSWRIYAGHKERTAGIEARFLAPGEINWLPEVLFVLKVLAVVTAYVALAWFLIAHI